MLAGEDLEQTLALTGTQPLDATLLGDIELFHDLGGLGLAIARQRLDKSADRHASGCRILRVQNLLEGNLTVLDLLAKLGAGVTGSSSLFKVLSTLLFGKLGKCHRRTPNQYESNSQIETPAG
jgi:hypothetical protein